MGWRDVSFQKLPLEIVERKLKHGNEQLILFARLANISLSLVASFSVLLASMRLLKSCKKLL